MISGFSNESEHKSECCFKRTPQRDGAVAHSCAARADGPSYATDQALGARLRGDQFAGEDLNAHLYKFIDASIV
jgi:hypothetical protein